MSRWLVLPVLLLAGPAFAYTPTGEQIRDCTGDWIRLCGSNPSEAAIKNCFCDLAAQVSAACNRANANAANRTAATRIEASLIARACRERRRGR